MSFASSAADSLELSDIGYSIFGMSIVHSLRLLMLPRMVAACWTASPSICLLFCFAEIDPLSRSWLGGPY